MEYKDLDGQVEATFVLSPLLARIPQPQVPESDFLDPDCEMIFLVCGRDMISVKNDIFSP